VEAMTTYKKLLLPKEQGVHSVIVVSDSSIIIKYLLHQTTPQGPCLSCLVQKILAISKDFGMITYYQLSWEHKINVDLQANLSVGLGEIFIKFKGGTSRFIPLT